MLRTTKNEVWDKMRGKLRSLKADKGFGFIKGDDDKDYFMHHTACGRLIFAELTNRFNRGEEALLEFTPTKGDKGPRAEDVRIYA